jgi:hypothetical protein
MKIICNYCQRDINEIHQANMSDTLEIACCEDCYQKGSMVKGRFTATEDNGSGIYTHSFHFNSKVSLTIDMLNKFTPHSIPFYGGAFDNPKGLNMTNSGKELTWILSIGEVGDWCIYVHFKTDDLDFVHDHGDKVISRENIENLFDFNDEVWKRYRF